MAGLERGSLWGRLIVRRQLLLWWWLNSPWAPGHICGVSVMLMFVVVLLFLVLVQGLTKVRDQSRALEDRNDSNNSLEVYTPNSFIHLFYNSPYMNVVDMHNILNIPSDSVLWEKTMEASYLVGSFPCQFNFKSVFDIPVWDEFWEQATFGHFCPSWQAAHSKYPLSPHQVMVGTLESRFRRIHLYLSQQIGVRSSKTSQCSSANRPSVVPQGSPRVLVPF